MQNVSEPPCLKHIRNKYMNLLSEVTRQVKEDAIQELTGKDLAGVLDAERLYRSAVNHIGRGGECPKEIAILAESKGQSIPEFCTELIADRYYLWLQLDYVLCVIEAAKIVVMEQYQKATSETDLLLVPAPEWPDITSLKEVYRHTPKI